jgi:hypothetical protein
MPPYGLISLQEYIEHENERLSREGQFWSKEIVVKIEYKYCPNLTIIDTPGNTYSIYHMPSCLCVPNRASTCMAQNHSTLCVPRPCRSHLCCPRQAQHLPSEQLPSGGDDGAPEDGAERVHHPLPGGLQRLEQCHHTAPRHAGETDECTEALHAANTGHPSSNNACETLWSSRYIALYVYFTLN